MAKFYFHLVSPLGHAADESGAEFATFEDAYLDAHQAALDISFELLRERRDPNSHRFEIVDAGGRFLADLRFADVLRPHASTLPTLHGEIHRRLDRCQQLRGELVLELAATQAEIETARATLVRSREQGI